MITTSAALRYPDFGSASCSAATARVHHASDRRSQKGACSRRISTAVSARCAHQARRFDPKDIIRCREGALPKSGRLVSQNPVGDTLSVTGRVWEVEHGKRGARDHAAEGARYGWRRSPTASNIAAARLRRYHQRTGCAAADYGVPYRPQRPDVLPRHVFPAGKATVHGGPARVTLRALERWEATGLVWVGGVVCSGICSRSGSDRRGRGGGASLSRRRSTAG